VQQHQREFAEFYAATRDDCLRVVLMTAGDRLLAEDLVAEAYTRAWLSWRKVRGLDQPRAWVVRTALNTRISWWRRRRREVGLDGQDYEHASPASQDGTDQRGLRGLGPGPGLPVSARPRCPPVRHCTKAQRDLPGRQSWTRHLLPTPGPSPCFT